MKNNPVDFYCRVSESYQNNGSAIVFENCLFETPIYFDLIQTRSRELAIDLIFKQCMFEKIFCMNSESVDLTGNISFGDCEFQSEFQISEYEMSGELEFYNCTFHKKFEVFNSRFNNKVHFRDNQFLEGTNLFDSTKKHVNVYFQDIEFFN